MCTVSYSRNEYQTIFTSNRDEHILRANALAPTKYRHENRWLYYPKDPKKLGTWFCVDDSNNVIILLNGAEKKHRSVPPYHRSRGLIVLDLFRKQSILAQWKSILLRGVEPFTLIVYEKEKLYKLQWNALEKTSLRLNENQDHIFSSSTLYSYAIQQERKNWFAEYKSKHGHLSPEDLIIFHTTTKPHDKENGLLINRKQQMLTKSVTQLTIDSSQSVLKHFDLIQHISTELCLTAHYI